MTEPFLGEIKLFASNFPPRGYADCSGQLLPISQNSALFSLLGTIYGGDGRVTFGLPDLQGRVPLHQGSGPGLSTYRIGARGGSTTASLGAVHLPVHRHPSAATGPATLGDPGGNQLGDTGSAPIYTDVTPDAALAASASASAGGSAPHNNLSPFLTIRFIIALVGVFPSRN